ncbi:NAD(P)/FAD-dependent oxidoreductase [Pelagibius marinus]|uniref:NAD(P)/FAD-dependent oxidoreductase n=1 Tax=Pelagibius marinus TaxID=2762760 RepID=UPI001872247A|nr:FAD-dependent oxidoreductase [Pelagibius marinus]
MKVAVVGAGIAGLGAAWALSQKHRVTVFEAADRLGGHANTRNLCLDGRRCPVDTGFIVYNEINYPQLTKLFAHIGVETQASDMSFSVSLDRGRREYAGSLPGLLAQPSNLLRPRHLGMLYDVARFYRSAPAILEDASGCEKTLGEMLEEGGYSRAFAEEHILPMGAAIWSSTLADMRNFPARSFVRFFVNHGLLLLGERPQWRTVTGGSQEYVRRLSAGFRNRVRLKSPVTGLRRTAAGVLLRSPYGGEEHFDHVVLATHADQTLQILGDDAGQREREILGAFRYQENRAVLHSDISLMPRRRSVWSSWNYLAETASRTRGGDAATCVSYWMNRLQNLPGTQPIIVTLNPLHEPAADKVFGEFTYDHPQFDASALRAQRNLPVIQGEQRTWFCGSYCGHGFHEDGLQAGLAVARALGAAAPWADEVEPASPAAATVQPLEPLQAAE